jgi:hypothetical protein
LSGGRTHYNNKTHPQELEGNYEYVASSDIEKIRTENQLQTRIAPIVRSTDEGTNEFSAPIPDGLKQDGCNGEERGKGAKWAKMSLDEADEVEG